MWKWIFRFSALPKRWIKVTAPVCRFACQSCLADQTGRQGAMDDAEHLTHDRRAGGEQEALRIREAQHPLPHGDFGQDVIHQQGRALCRPAVRQTTPAHNNGSTPSEARLPRTTRRRFALPGAQRRSSWPNHRQLLGRLSAPEGPENARRKTCLFFGRKTYPANSWTNT